MSLEPSIYGRSGEYRAERLGSALRQLAGDLVEERRKVAALRRELAERPSRRDRDGDGIAPVRSEPSLDAADREAIERDLNDRVQERLTALRIRLGAAARDFSGSGDTEAGAAFAESGDQLAEVIAELRAIAAGIYPPLLASGGLGVALAAAAERSSSPVSVVQTGIGRYSPAVELAVYCTVLAAIDSAERHAGPGRVTVVLSQSAEGLSFSVSDESAGFDRRDVTAGGGLAIERAWLTAVGGSLEAASRPSQGTRIAGAIPLAPEAPGPSPRPTRRP